MAPLTNDQVKELQELIEYKKKIKNREHRYQVKVKLLLQKAKKANITVSEQEIDEELKKK